MRVHGKPPMNYRPSFCIVNTVSILYLSKTTEDKPRTFQQDVSVNSFRFDVSTQLPIKNQLFLGKTKKTKKASFETLCGQTPQRWFFWFSPGKNGFGQENQLFPRKKMVLDNQLFPRENQKNKKKQKHHLRHYATRHQKDGFLVFSREKDGFGQENQLFPRTKMVLGRKTIFFLGKTKKQKKIF